VNAQGFLGGRSIEVTKGTGGVPTYLPHDRTELSMADAQALQKDNPYRFAENITNATGETVAQIMRPVLPEVITRLQPMKLPFIRVFNFGSTNKVPGWVWNDQGGRYDPFDLKDPTNKYLLPPKESPALSDVLEKITGKVNEALPGIFNLTNQLSAVLTNSTRLVNNANQTISGLRPVITEATNLLLSVRPVIENLNGITKNLNNTNGALGQWLIPPELRASLQQTLSNANGTLITANATLTNADTNLVLLVDNINKSLENLAAMTGNLNAQVQANTNIVTQISAAIVHTDDLIQGLKHHWLLRSAFKTNKPPAKASPAKK